MDRKFSVSLIILYFLCAGLVVPGWANGPTGTWNSVVLMVDFSDHPGTATRGDFNSLLFGNHPPNAPNGSLKDYYAEVSYGQLTLMGQVNNGSINWYRMPQPYAYYLVNTEQLFPDAIQSARNAGFDFGPFDSDNDGYVDAISIVHAGTGQELSGCTCDIWSFARTDTSIDTGGVNVLGHPVFTGRYAVEPEWYVAPGYMTIGVFAHEFGHNLGLPDLYDADLSSRGLGIWSLMATGMWNGNYGNQPAHLDAWSKVRLGWVNPVTPTGALGLNLPPVENNPSIYKLYTTNQEYFLLENRQQTGFDAGLPGSGLLIYHVDDFITTDDNKEWYPGCATCASHYKVALVQADGQWYLDRNINSGDSGDPYPGFSNNTTFDTASYPSSLTYLNISSGVSITGIALSGSNVTASLTVSPTINMDFPVAQATRTQTNPRTASDGDNYLVAWNDARNNANQVYAARVSASKTVIDPAGIFIANGQLDDVSFDGTHYLVVWGQNGNLFATRVALDGSVLDPGGIPIHTGGTAYAARAAFDGTHYMIVWFDYRSGNIDIYGARLTPSGGLLDPGGLALVTGPGDQSLPEIAYGGGNYFLVWSGPGLMGSRLSTAGALLDPGGIAISAAWNKPAVVYQGTGFLTLWAENGYVKGVRVGVSGTLLDPSPLVILTTGALTPTPPAAVFDGVNDLLIWQDGDGHLQGTYVTPAGTPLSSSVTFSTDASLAEYPAVAAGLGGSLVVWADWRNDRSSPTCSIPGCDIDIYANFIGSRLSNVSTRARVQTGSNVMIGGFIIDGLTPKRVLIRARGPSMGGAPFNVVGALLNPKMKLYSGQTVIAQNDDWQTTDGLCAFPAVSCGGAAEIGATGLDPCQPNPGQTAAPPGCGRESALLVTLPPGPYSSIISGVGGTIGVGLVEVIELNAAEASILVNISARARVETGPNVEIGGFIVGGRVPKTVLIRARGPSMGGAPFFIPVVLANPTLTLYSGQTAIARNDDWQTTVALCASPSLTCGNAGQIAATGIDPCVPNPGQTSAPPGCNRESAILVTLPPGPYSAKVSGVGGTTGVGLVEVVEVGP